VLRTFDHHDFDASSLVEAKGGQRVSVCLPAHNEEATVGAIVGRIRQHLVEGVPLVDEVLVIDDHSTDATARVAQDAGAIVIDAAGTLPDAATGPGKGRALWKSVHACSGDLVVWCDADVSNFGPHFVVGLLGPLLTQPGISYVKGFYRRPLSATGDGGGRVTELVARPLLSLLYPALTSFVQPLSGEYAGRRSLFEQLPFVSGYGVEVGLLVDISSRFGVDTMAQVDLGTRLHRNRTLHELGPQAMTIMQVLLRRADPTLVGDHADLMRPGQPPRPVSADEMPPLVSLPEYRHRRAVALGDTGRTAGD
jgi:glucosyl-3-phosphoglycerate synthase